jgi:hypothetical protein
MRRVYRFFANGGVVFCHHHRRHISKEQTTTDDDERRKGSHLMESSRSSQREMKVNLVEREIVRAMQGVDDDVYSFSNRE